MKRLPIPASEHDWRRTASAIIQANLKLAQMNQINLAAALRGLGIEESPKAISAKLARGTFSATFLLQCLTAIGVEQIELPRGGGLR